MNYKLLYMAIEAEKVETSYGFSETIGIDNYRDASLRSKVVFRVDLFDVLTDMFSESVLAKHRDLLYNI